MGWSIHYRVELPRPLSPTEQEWVWRHTADPRFTLDGRSEPFELCHRTAGDLAEALVPAPETLWGATKIRSSRRPGNDFAVVIAALRALVSRFPGSRVIVSDDYYLHEVPLEQIDSDALRDRIERDAEPREPHVFATRGEMEAVRTRPPRTRASPRHASSSKTPPTVSSSGRSSKGSRAVFARTRTKMTRITSRTDGPAPALARRPSDPPPPSHRRRSTRRAHGKNGRGTAAQRFGWHHKKGQLIVALSSAHRRITICSVGRLKIDRETRRQGLARLRREQVIAESRLTPMERLARASELTSFGARLHPDTPPTPASRPRPRRRSRTTS